jgi:hypothetical protein
MTWGMKDIVEGEISRLILLICGLFNDAVNSLDYVESNDGTINELERMYKEAIVI